MRLIALVGRSAAQSRHVLLGAMLIFSGFQFLLILHAAEIESAQGFSRLAELIPGFLQRGLGGQALQLATFRGSVAFGYFHPIVLCAVSLIAVYLATEPAHDVEAGFVDLVLARSVPRRRLITRSLLLAAGSITIIAVLMMVGTFVGLRVLAPEMEHPSFALIAVLAIHLVAVAWCCASVGLLIAAAARRWTTAFSAAAAFVIIGYLVDFLAIGWPPVRAIAWLFPFYYFPAIPIVAGHGNPIRDLMVLAGASAVLTALAYWTFDKRDL